MSAARISAEDLSAAVRVHADRVHDFVRRLGCSPAAAAEVVETSALDLVETAAGAPRQVQDAVGWWFGRARALGARVAGGQEDIPLGGGLLAADADQALVAEALDLLPERERVAVLLADSYALPAASVGVALGTDADAAMETAGRGRLRFLQAIGDDLPSTGGHPVDLGALARIGMGGPVAARDATPRRHAQSCTICGGIWAAQERAHRLLAGLTVAALPDAERDGILSRIEAEAQSVLPSAATMVLDEDDEEYDDERPSRLLVPLYVLAAVALAVLLGAAVGILASRDPGSGRGDSSAADDDQGVLPPVTAPPAPTLSVAPTALPSPTDLPSPRVFTVAPSPTGPLPGTQPSSGGMSPEPANEPLTLTGDPSSGPNGQTVTVQGTGWTPGATVVLEYYDPLGRSTGSRAEAVVDPRGRFTTGIAAQDPANLPGRHTIRATDGTFAASTPYDVSG